MTFIVINMTDQKNNSQVRIIFERAPLGCKFYHRGSQRQRQLTLYHNK